MQLQPIALRHARAFVAQHHRHNVAPRGWLFGVALEHDGQVIAVAIAERPKARALQDGCTIEVSRVCVDPAGAGGAANAASRLYGSLCRAAAALGYRRAITYTLASEPGTSLRAAGFHEAERLGPRSSWASKGRGRHDTTIWGDAILPDEPRVRWERTL